MYINAHNPNTALTSPALLEARVANAAEIPSVRAGLGVGQVAVFISLEC
jgi:hypothetical protein